MDEPADPISPGAMPLASVVLTKAQVRQLAEAMEEHLANGGRLDGVRVELLREGYARAVLIGPDGDGVAEKRLWPQGFESG